VNKKTFICTIVVSLFAYTQMAVADYIVQSTGGIGPSGYYVGPYGYSDGGEFTFTSGMGANTLDTSGYASTTKNVVSTSQYGQTFQTFCVEMNVPYYPNTPYSATLSDYSSESLTQGAAWLYWQFATGQLQGYDYNNTSTTNFKSRNISAGALQQEIWYLMGQISTDPNNIFSNDVKTAIGIGNLFINNGNYGVQVLNLKDANNTPAQNQLFLIPQDVTADKVLTHPTPIN
jgi:hypothetical protein